MPTGQPNSSRSPVGDAEPTDARPDAQVGGVLPPARARLATALSEGGPVCDAVCALRSRAPTPAMRELPVSLPKAYVPIEAPNWNCAPPRMAPGWKLLDCAVSNLPETCWS